MTVSHKPIKRFHIDGEIYDEAAIPRIKEQYIDLLRSMMQGKGYVVRLDIDPDFTIVYNGKTFRFDLSVYAVFVGRKKAQCYLGVDKNRPVMNSIQKSKSKESWNPAESR
jgi:hypothetical protein